MTFKALALAGATVFALGGLAHAADVKSTASSDTTIHNDAAKPDPAAINPNTGKTYGDKPGALKRAGAEAVTETEEAVGAGDKFSSQDLGSQIAISKVGQPKNTLSTAKVDNQNGEILGEVDSVVLGANGQPSAVNVEVGGYLGVGERVIALSPGDLQYMPDRNILVTHHSKAELEKMPAIKK